MNKTIIKAMMIMVASLTTGNAYADSDVSAELRAQNTPTGWTAVQLPSIPAITSANTYDITSYGASTTSADNSTAINAAITAATSKGGMVVIPEGKWIVANSLYIKSNVVLHLNANATLQMAPYGTYPQNKNAYLITTSSSVTNVIIEGESMTTSIIDGQGAEWWTALESNKSLVRPGALIRFTKGSKFLVRNLGLQNAPNTNLTLGNSGNASHFTVHDVRIINPSSIDREATADGFSCNSHNTDGIPIWGPYTNIYDCYIDTGDDNIVFDSNAQYGHVWNCTFKRGHGASTGSFTEKVHHIIWEGISMDGTAGGFKIKSQHGRGGNDQSGTNSNGSLNNFIFRNSTINDVAEPLVLTTHYDGEIEDPSTCTPATITYQTPEFCNILFQNITSTNIGSSYTGWSRQRPIYIYGLPEISIHDVTFDNVRSEASKGMYMAYCKNIIFKNGCNIPSGFSTDSQEYQAFADNGTTKVSANPSKYNGSEKATTCEVKFMNGKDVYKTETICPDSYAYPPTAPTKEGYIFLGWATSEGGTAVSLAATQLATGGTFYALWESKTGINEVQSSKIQTSSSKCYNLQGQQVSNNAKGIIISNGKKILVR